MLLNTKGGTVRQIAADSLEDAYDLIRAQPGFENFLSYQVLVDLLYPVDAYDGDSVLPFSPDDWSSPGPGAQKGLKQLVTEINGFDRLAVMRWLQQHQQEEFDRLDIDFPYLETEDGGRALARTRRSGGGGFRREPKGVRRPRR